MWRTPLRTSCYSGLIQPTLAILTVRTLSMQVRSRALADSISRPSSIPTPSGPSQTQPSSAKPYQQDIHYSCRSAQRPVPPFFAEQTRVLSTAGSPKPTITSSTLRSTTSSTHKPRQIIRRLTAFLRHSLTIAIQALIPLGAHAGRVSSLILPIM